jgi:hypothetical protein
MKKIISLIAVIAVFGLLLNCAGMDPKARGAGVGAGVGGVAGALLDNSNPWRGGVIGAALGAVFGATIADISAQASRESVQTGQPVEYKTTDGRGVYRADPVDYNARTNCHKVQERVWEDGQLVKDEIKEVCEGEKTEQRY